MFSLCERSNAFIVNAFCLSKIHFNKSGPLKLIKTMLKSFGVLLGLSSIWNYIQRVICVLVPLYLLRPFPLLELIHQESIIKTLILCNVTI